MAPASKPFQLLEINIISAQDLEPVSKKMKTYATAWMNPNRKLSSSVDSEGNNNPTWNDKFVFRVDEEFLRRDTSAVMIQIHAQHWFRDVLVGTVRVLVGNLIPPGRNQRNHHMGMRFVALQIRRPSGRPQGILNIGVALLDSSMRSMPLYTQLSMSAVGYRDLNDDPPNLPAAAKQNKETNNDNDSSVYASTIKPILRRVRSERSSTLGFDSINPNSSILAPRAETILVPKDGYTPSHNTNSVLAPKAETVLAPESSILSIEDYVDPFKMKKMGKASSVISGAELRERPKGKKGKPSSVLSDSILSKESSSVFLKTETTSNSSDSNFINKNTGRNDMILPGIDRSGDKSANAKIGATKSNLPPATMAKSASKYSSSSGFPFGAPPPPPPPKGVLTPQGKYVMGAPVKKGNSLWSDSEVGPSPSEVAAAMMAERKYPLEQQDNQSSVLDGWSLDESVEGLRSKLERWRMELPPLYDRGGFSTSSYKSSGTITTNTRRPNNRGSGLFSCFGNIFGYECQCICGKPPGKKRRTGKFQSPSTITPGRSFV